MNKTHLKNLYDCINTIAQEHEARGKDRSGWFYTDAEFEKVKRDSRNNIF
jgi:hypothetical protein